MKQDQNPPLKILFIVHEMHRTGAPIVILDFMKWMKKHNKNIVFDLLALNTNGTLLEEFSQLVRKIHVFPRGHIRLRQRILNILTNKKKNPLYDFGQLILAENYTHVYINSIHVLNDFIKIKHYLGGAKKVLHVHETEYLTDIFFVRTNQAYILSEIDKFIAVSDHVKNNLKEKYKIPAEKILLKHPFINDNQDESTINKPLLRQQLQIKDSDFVVGCIGTPQLIKGTDLIPIITKKIKTKYPDFQFKYLSVGGYETNDSTLMAKFDAKKLQVEENILFLPHTEDVNSYLNLMDAYILTSREESFSLMIAKAVLNEIPVIMFADNGGPCEIIDSHHCIVVDYLDIDEMANQILYLKNNYENAKNKSRNAKKILENFIKSKENNNNRLLEFITNK